MNELRVGQDARRSNQLLLMVRSLPPVREYRAIRTTSPAVERPNEDAVLIEDHLMAPAADARAEQVGDASLS
jgi:hypothetical protein